MDTTMSVESLPSIRATRPAAVSRMRERALVRDAARGSEQALAELFRRHWRPAYRAAYLVVHDANAAEDIAQEAFLSAVRALDRFDRRRPFGPWIHRIAVNRAIDWLRARTLRAEVSAELVAEEGADDEWTASGRPSSRPYSDSVVEALRALSPEHRAVVVLRHLLEYTPGEIAAMLELPRGTVNSRLRRGLDHLNRQLGEEAP
jgi:RNA polymerase sigma-70 factor (ECF subfamily)